MKSSTKKVDFQQKKSSRKKIKKSYNLSLELYSFRRDGSKAEQLEKHTSNKI